MRCHDRGMTTQLKLMPPPADDDAADPLIALDREGWAVLPGLLDAAACGDLAALYDAPAGFRSHIHMPRHGFGRGEYRSFAYPLPPLVEALRSEEHTSELQSLMRISYAAFCLKTKTTQ